MPILNYIQSCSRNYSGNMYVFLTEVANIVSVTIVSGEVTVITMATGETFKQIQADVNGIVRLCKQGSSQKDKVFYGHTVSMTISKARIESNDLANQLSIASSCGIIAIVMDNNGQAWLVGWNESDKGNRPLYLQSDNFTSGKDITEPEGGKRIFQLFGNSGFIDLPLNDTLSDYIINQIIAGAGSAIELEFTQAGVSPTMDSTIITMDSTAITMDST